MKLKRDWRETGAITFKLVDFFENLYPFLEYVEFGTHLTLIVVGRTLDFGICVWCNEYDVEFAYWGVDS
jgi:hypothetical protein